MGKGEAIRLGPKAPWWVRIAYGSGTMGYSILEIVVIFWLGFFNEPPEGAHLPKLLPEPLFGIIPIFAAIWLFGRVIDSIADPIVAAISDRSHFRLGRRVPFMTVGIVPLVLAAILLFYPWAETASVANMLYLLVMLTVYCLGYTLYVVPYSGLLPELAHDDSERINLTSLQAIFGLVGLLTGFVLSDWLISKYQFKGMISLLAPVAGVFLLLPVFAVNERKYCRARPTRLRPFDSVLAMLRRREAMIYLMGFILFRIGFFVIVMAMPYYKEVLLQQPKENLLRVFWPALATAAVAFPATNLVARRHGKRATMRLTLLIAAGGFALTGLFGPVHGHGGNRIFAMFVSGAVGFALPALFILPNAFVADLADTEYRRTGEANQAMYYGAQGFFAKMALGLSAFVLMFLLVLGKGGETGDLGVRLTGPVAGGLALLGWWVFRHYPSDRPRRSSAGA